MLTKQITQRQRIGLTGKKTKRTLEHKKLYYATKTNIQHSFTSQLIPRTGSKSRQGEN